MPQPPRHDPQHNYDEGKRNVSQTSQQPQFDPRDSHDAGKRPYQWHNLEQWPTIPVPKFTSFDVGSALLPPEPQPEPSLPSHQTVAQSTTITQSNDLNRYRAVESPHVSSTSLVGTTEADRCAPTSKPWDPQAASAPSPEQQHVIVALPDAQSISTTDFSINTAGVFSPGSHQASDTSFREDEHREDRGGSEQQGDDSFYWHSGRSSSDLEEDQGQSGSPTATPGDDNVGQRSSTITSMGIHPKHQDLPVRSTSLSPTSATYGASALGFGGPSDWEYFGDYEAEEIDDEELYSRPRPRNLKSEVEGSTELPTDSALDSEQLSSNLTQLGRQSLHEKSPARPLSESSSQENVMQEQGLEGVSKDVTGSRPPSAHGSAGPRTITAQAAPSTGISGQQRPDLDDVIRAWSEAPYVGKVDEVAPLNGALPDNDEKPVDNAEASLASTPRERMLGVDVRLRDAPSLPKSPDSGASLKPEEQVVQRNASTSSTPLGAQSAATNPGREMQPLSNRQQPATDYMSANAEVKAQTEEDHSSESEMTMQSVLPSVDVVVSSGSSLSVPSESGINTMSLDVDPSNDTFTCSREHRLPQALRGSMPTDSDEKAHGSSQIYKSEIDQHVQQSVNYRVNCEQNLQDTVSEFSEKSRETTSCEATAMMSSRIIESLSQGDTPSEHLLASPEVAREEPNTLMTPNILQGNFDAGNCIQLRQDHSHEPTTTPNTQTTSDRSPSTESTASAPPQANAPPLTSDAPLPRRTTSSEVDTVQGPYSDLDPWGKASLNRFAAMLREESRAETNQDKLNIFNVFTSRESRLRVVLYGTDDELIVSQKSVQQKVESIRKSEKGGFVKQAVERANSMGLERSLKALPALPANRESVMGLPRNALAQLIIQHGSTSKEHRVDPEVRLSADDSKTKEELIMASGPSVDDACDTIRSSSDEVEYSPGGRPLAARLRKTAQGTDVQSSQDAKTAFEKDSAPSSETSGSARRVEPQNSVRLVTVGPEDFEAPRKPGYMPLTYNEGRSEVKNYLANRKSVCRPYATLTQGSLESVSIFGKNENIKLAGSASIITAPTSQWNPNSRPKLDNVATTNKQKASEVEGPTDLRRFVDADFDPLLMALPKAGAFVHESARLSDLRNVMDAVPDHFSFIHQSVIAWDAKAKKRREENDGQRHARQVESEQKIDSLFDDHVIGYGDIGDLEDEFKRSEAARRADEDRFEYQTFVSDVFNLVWTRLHYELDQLIPHYEQYCKLMDHTLAGKDMFEGSEEGLALGPTMSSFLALHQKLEIRHQKAFEAVLERDRRLKKTELSPWYTLGNIAKVKQLEKQFDDAEKKAIIEYCQLRNARANRLMDVLDQNTLRGVGANQDYMEAIMKAVRRTASGRAFASVPSSSEPTPGLEEVEKAKAITARLASSSEQIVQTFHVAEMLLNSADYEVSLAKAKVARADLATPAKLKEELAKLKEERAKEDQKLMRDLEHRLALIREGSRRTNDEIVKLMLFLGIQNGRADSAPGRAGMTEAGHEARIQKALEDAKRRNATKKSEG